MTDMVDARLYEELAGRDPRQVVLEPYCEFVEEQKRFLVRAWGRTYYIDPQRGKAGRCDGGAGAGEHEYFYIFLVNYLLSPKKIEPAGKWLSVKDLPGGATFFRGPHTLPTELIVRAHGNDLAALQRRCAELGGSPLEMADFSCVFSVVGAVRVALLYWLGDEDFPPEAGLLIDASLADLQLDIIYALLCDVCRRLAGREGH